MKECKITQTGQEIEVSINGQHWHLQTAGNLEELWEKIGVEDYNRIPYWVELWPSSLILGIWLNLSKLDIFNKICLDLGCGIGLTALIGQNLRAKVIAVDYEPQALSFCKINARLNHVDQPAWILMDWTNIGLKRMSIERIWASDIAYEKVFWEPLLNLFDFALAQNGLIWLAEPGRNIFLSFLEKAGESGWIATPVYTGSMNAAQKITIWQLGRY